MKENMFIVLEGLDGSGKTTIGNSIVRQIGGCYLYSLSPLFKPIKTAIEGRDNALLRYLYYANSLVALQDEIENVLSQGNLVLDRYIDSTILYHSALDVDTSVVDVNKLGLRKPDYVFVLFVNREERLKRLEDRGNGGEHDLYMLNEVSANLEALFLYKNSFHFTDITYFLKNEDEPKTVLKILETIKYR